MESIKKEKAFYLNGNVVMSSLRKGISPLRKDTMCPLGHVALFDVQSNCSPVNRP
jgi:hypothetical protein